MITERETLQRIGVWMEEGRTSLPDHVLDAVLLDLPKKPQRRPWRPARGFPHKSAYAKVAIAAAAVVVIAIVGFNVFRPPDSNDVGNATPSPAPSVSPTPAASPSPATATPTANVLIEPGPYRWTAPGGTATVVLPDGWVESGDGIAKPSGGTEILLTPHLSGSGSEVARVFSDACVTDTGIAPNSNSVAIGPTGDDLVQALEDQIGTDATITSFAGGTRVSLTEAAGLDRSLCSEGRDGWLKIWLDRAGDQYFRLQVGFHGEASIFERDGKRFVLSAQIGDGAREADVAELRAIIETFAFARSPRDASAGPALAPPRRPGNGPSPAGVYGLDGGDGSILGMHKVKDGHQTSLIFRLGPRCLAWTEGQQAEMVRVAGFDGVAIEPYLPTMHYAPGMADETTRAHALAIGDSTLCVFVTWDAGTDDATVAAALDVLDTLRVEAIPEGLLRVNFTLDEGWDVG
jgi:hypothetical protein